MVGSAEGVSDPVGDLGNPELPLPLITVLIAIEVRLYREGLVHSLARQTGLRVVGSAAGTAEAMTTLRELRPQILLLDLGIEGAAAFVREARETAPETRVVALGVQEVEREVLQYAEAGVAGYVPRDATLAELVAVLESAAQGELRCSPRIAAALFRRVEALAEAPVGADEQSLTRREREVVMLLDQGASNKEISRRLHIELSTVKNHVHNILTKLQLPGRSAIPARGRRTERSSTAS